MRHGFDLYYSSLQGGSDTNTRNTPWTCAMDVEQAVEGAPTIRDDRCAHAPARSWKHGRMRTTS